MSSAPVWRACLALAWAALAARAAAAGAPPLIITSPGHYDGHGAEVGYLYVRASDVTVRNFRVTGAGPDIACVSFEGDRITIRQIEVSGCGSVGVRFWSGTDNVLEDSLVRDPVTRPGRDSWGIYQGERAGRIVVRRVIVHGSGFSVYAPHGSALIEDNEFYIPDGYRTDCKGTRQPGGPCQCGEFGIGLKSGHVTVRRNRIAGYRQSDAVCGGSGTPGAAIDPAACGVGQSCPTPDVLIEDNLLTDSHVGTYIGPHSQGLVVRNNVYCRNDFAISDGFSGATTVIGGNAFRHNGADYHGYGKARGLVRGNRKASREECESVPPQALPAGSVPGNPS